MSTHVYSSQLFYQNGLPMLVNHQGQYRQWLRNSGMLLAERVNGYGQGYLLAVDDNGSVLKGLTASSEDSVHRFTAYGHGAGRHPAHTLAGFKGERLDAQTQGYFFGNGYRLHMPTLMRFSAPDSLSPFNEGGLNAYAYCGCDPINHEDPSGHAVVFKIRTRGYRTPFKPALRKRTAILTEILGKLAPRSKHLLNNVLDDQPKHLLNNVLDDQPKHLLNKVLDVQRPKVLERLSKARPALERKIAKRSSKNLDVFMRSAEFEGLQPAFENPPPGIRPREVSKRLQAQIMRNTPPEVHAYLNLFGNTLNDPRVTSRNIRDA
ncbi:RHS repeat-associated core domain-containing protein [Pseudomonas putida]|uniref:RHS repeat-associated core domain-containing protein n=1 Tax=Pseudomonas putida TaxID=303 RepID=UPI0018E68F14|nr:RHS repeat-associated core domain-containing protein [Pseudomonas putida]MBI6923290.1 RHS repeat-associated core domain-containing protein [Pseudomonas putida]